MSGQPKQCHVLLKLCEDPGNRHSRNSYPKSRHYYYYKFNRRCFPKYVNLNIHFDSFYPLEKICFELISLGHSCLCTRPTDYLTHKTAGASAADNDSHSTLFAVLTLKAVFHSTLFAALTVKTVFHSTLFAVLTPKAVFRIVLFAVLTLKTVFHSTLLSVLTLKAVSHNTLFAVLTVNAFFHSTLFVVFTMKTVFSAARSRSFLLLGTESSLHTQQGHLPQQLSHVPEMRGGQSRSKKLRFWAGIHLQQKRRPRRRVRTAVGCHLLRKALPAGKRHSQSYGNRNGSYRPKRERGMCGKTHHETVGRQVPSQ